jgi:hypothetical protein
VARFSSAYRTNATVGSTTLPSAGLMAQASTPMWLVEVWVSNTAVTAMSLGLRRIVTAAGTPGAAQTVQYEENDTVTLKGDPRDTWTVAPTLATGFLRLSPAGASIGSGWIGTFGSRGLYVPPGTTNGLGLITLTGTAQVLDVTWVWDA